MLPVQCAHPARCAQIVIVRRTPEVEDSERQREDSGRREPAASWFNQARVPIDSEFGKRVSQMHVAHTPNIIPVPVRS